jgi:mannose-6-phosphate isomerase-like protein (cupin superfamily)
VPISNWREQVYNVIGSVLYNNPRRTVHFMVRDHEGRLRDRTELPAPVRRLAETHAEDGRECLRTIQFVHHALIPPGGRHVHELHIHPDAEELVVITTGRGEFRIGAETKSVETGDVAYIPPGAEHALTNPGPELLGAIFINVPTGDALLPLLDSGEPEGQAS